MIPRDKIILSKDAIRIAEKRCGHSLKLKAKAVKMNLTDNQIVERLKNITNEQLNALCDIELTVLGEELRSKDYIYYEDDPHWGKIAKVKPGRGSVKALRAVIEKLLSNEDLAERQYP